MIGNGNGERSLKPDEVEAWLKDTYSIWERWKMRAWAFYFNKRPRNIRAAALVHWTLKTALACSAPVLAAIYTTIDWLLAAVLSGSLFAAHTLAELVNRLDAQPSKVGQEISTVLRFGDLLTAMGDHIPGTPAEVDVALTSAVAIVQDVAQTVVGRQEIGVSVLLYNSNKRDTMTVVKRHPGSEGVLGRPIDASTLFGHHLCEVSRSPHVIHDIQRLSHGAQQSPTKSERSYRSLFIVPLTDSVPKSKQMPKGFVTITCDEPYAFYGNRTRALIVNCQPLFDKIYALA